MPSCCIGAAGAAACDGHVGTKFTIHLTQKFGTKLKNSQDRICLQRAALHCRSVEKPMRKRARSCLRDETNWRQRDGRKSHIFEHANCATLQRHSGYFTVMSSSQNAKHLSPPSLSSSAAAASDAPIQPLDFHQQLPFFVYGTLCSGFRNWEAIIKVTLWCVHKFRSRDVE